MHGRTHCDTVSSLLNNILTYLTVVQTVGLKIPDEARDVKRSQRP